MQKLEQEFWDLKMEGSNHAVYTDRFHELAKLVPHLVTPESKRIDRYVYGLIPQIRSMVRATEPPTIQSAIVKAGALTDEMIRDGEFSKQGEKRKENPETSGYSGNSENNKRGKTGNGNGRNNTGNEGYAGSAPKCGKCNFHHHHNVPCNVCTRCNRGGHTYKECRAKTKATPITAVQPGACYECGSFDHYRNACPKLNQAPRNDGGRQGQQLLEQGKQGQGSNGNQARGRAFALGVNEARQDPNTVSGTFSLNNHFVTVLFDSVTDLSFTSHERVPLLNMRPSELMATW